MREQRDHRGKKFVITKGKQPNEIVSEIKKDDKLLGAQIQSEINELKQAKATAGKAGEHPDVEVVKR